MIATLSAALNVVHVSPLEKLVLIMMAESADMDDVCLMDITELARACCCSLGDLTTAIDGLELAGYLTRAGRAPNQHECWQLFLEDDE